VKPSFAPRPERRFVLTIFIPLRNHAAVIRVFLLLFLVCPVILQAAGKAQHVVLIVWDGMRPDFISAEHTPTLYQLARDGVRFQKHHSVYCSATEVNGTALATGMYPENSGIIANAEFRPELNPLRATAMESLTAVRKSDQLSGGRHLLRPTVAEILQGAGRRTVVATAKQVGLLHDRRARSANFTNGVIVFESRMMPESLEATLTNLLGSFPPAVQGRSTVPNEPRDQWTTRALLGPLWSNGVPAFTLLWLSEPDFSQHASGPGSPKSLAALASSDRKLAEVLAELERRGLRNQTDVFVVSDHGFSTVERSVDVARVLREAGFNALREFRSAPERGDIVVAGQGGSVLFYVIERDSATIKKLVEFLQQQDFTGVLLTRKRMPGTFTLDKAMIDSAGAPDVVLSMRWSTNVSPVGAPGMFLSDGTRRPGEGNHASLSRFDMNNTLVAAGPDFKVGYIDTLPTGNVDVAPTILWLLGVKPPKRMDGRVLSEALTIEAPRIGSVKVRRLEADRSLNGRVWRQYLQVSRLNGTVYLDEGNGGLALEAGGDKSH
jgi:arylsulfatase A-like enzyme